MLKYFTYTLVSMVAAISFTVGATTTAFAKDRPPEPIENPGECPIDLPVRVASVDSLRQFEGLIGHCPEGSFVEAPAFRANRPRARTIDDAADTEALPPWQLPPLRGPREVALKVADRQPGSVPASKQAPRTRAFASPDGTQVVIVPAPGQFWEGSADGGSQAVALTDGLDDATQVLALRPQSYATAFDQSIASAARTHKVDPLLLHAVIRQESSYRPSATSRAGARGLMQVMPATGRLMGVKNAAHLYDPETNINAGARLLSQLWSRFDGNLDLVLAAYNAGEGAVRKYGNAIPPYRETQDYVVKVKANYRALAAESGLAVNF